MVNNLSNVGNTAGIMRKLQRIIIQKILYQSKFLSLSFSVYIFAVK